MSNKIQLTMHRFCFSVIENMRDLYSIQATTVYLNVEACFGNFTFWPTKKRIGILNFHQSEFVIFGKLNKLPFQYLFLIS